MERVWSKDIEVTPRIGVQFGIIQDYPLWRIGFGIHRMYRACCIDFDFLCWRFHAMVFTMSTDDPEDCPF
jgi:hypothetical protein